MRVIVATDLTALSARAIQRGFQLAGQLSAEMVVRHAVDVTRADAPDRAADAARRTLGTEIKRLAPAGAASPSIEISVGDPQDAIAGELAPADLIVLGIHSGSRERGKRFADSTAGRALKASRSACLLVREPVTGPYQRVVVGVDFSEHARVALHQAVAIAPVASAKLVHAYQVPFEGLIGGARFAASVAVAEHTQLDDFVQDEIARAGLDATRLDTVMREGDPAEVLRDVCREHDASLVVIATHGRKGLSRAVWGSVAANLLEDPPCDVLVVRQA